MWHRFPNVQPGLARPERQGKIGAKAKSAKPGAGKPSNSATRRIVKDEYKSQVRLADFVET